MPIESEKQKTDTEVSGQMQQRVSWLKMYLTIISVSIIGYLSIMTLMILICKYEWPIYLLMLIIAGFLARDICRIQNSDEPDIFQMQIDAIKAEIGEAN